MFNQKQYYQKNKESIKEYQKRWRKNNPEHRKEYDKKYRLEHRKQIEEYKKQYQKDNPEYMKGYMKKYCIKNKENHNKYNRIWQKTEKGKANSQRGKVKRKASEREIINTLTSYEWIDILKQYKFRCAYCGKEFTLYDRPTRDHIIPISKGGDNIKENIVPACQSCNSKKHNKLI